MISTACGTLGFTWFNGIDKERWTGVKALAWRLALRGRPSDLLLRLQEAISKFLDNPIAWPSKPQSKEDEVEAINVY